MTKINLIKPEDISELKYYKLDWDVVIGSVPYQVIRVENHVHTIGGHLDHGDGNNLWVYPLNEKMTFENLIEFDGEPGATWGMEYTPTNYIKTKWGETEVRRGRKLIITRNGEAFYDGLMTFHEAIAFIKDGILDEHPLSLNGRNFDKKCIGRKIWWRSQPAIVDRYVNGQACVIIKPDGIGRFTIPPEFENDDYDDDEDIKTTIFDRHIWWFRE